MAVTLQTPEQQSKSDVQGALVGPQQSQVAPGSCGTWQAARVPSDLRHETGLHCPGGCVLQLSHGAGVGGCVHARSQNVPAGQAELVEHGMPVHGGGGVTASRQNPHTQWRVAGSQPAFAKVMQLVGHWPLVFWQYGGEAALPGHSQQTGGATQPHLLDTGSFTHCDPGGNVGGHGPAQPPGTS